MSREREVYIGVYFRAYMPKVKYVDHKRCPKCNRRYLLSVKFCQDCGIETIGKEEDRFASFYDLCESVFEDGVRFSQANISGGDFVIVLGNKYSQPGFLFVDEDDDLSEQILPEEDYSGDWETLANALDERHIRYEKCYGIVSYWS